MYRGPGAHPLRGRFLSGGGGTHERTDDEWMDMSSDEVARLLERGRLSPAAIASAISGALAKPASPYKDPVWSLSDLTVEYGEPRIQIQGGNAGLARPCTGEIPAKRQ
jgi:hypothetical protein